MAVRSRRSNRYGVVPSLRPPNPPLLISTSFAVKTPSCVSALSTPKPSLGFKTRARIGGPPVAVETVPGRKTDVSDAEWLQRLHEYGLLRPSFRPQAEIAGLRAYLRQRERLLDYAAAHIQHMQKALMQMNLQLHHVVSDITGVTGQTWINPPRTTNINQA
jgi:hypothetical protein